MAKKSNTPQKPTSIPRNNPGGNKGIVKGQMPTMRTPPPPPPKTTDIK